MPNNDQLDLSPAEMRRLGYQAIDEIVAHFEQLNDKPAIRVGTRAELEARLREPLPEAPTGIETLFAQLQRDVWPFMGNIGHPRFFAFIPTPVNFVSVLADVLMSGFNPFVGSWLGGSAPAQIELVTVDWLRELCGLPATAGGHFVSGGSAANLTALAVARHVKLNDRFADAVVYFSDQTHSASERALRVLGFAPEQLCKLPSDAAYRLPLAALQAAVTADRANGRRPFCVIANAGATNTGAIDPLPELVQFCRAEDLWLHVDGAYGVAAVLCERGQALLAGLGEVDSLALDPHKWLFQTYEIGCVLVRDVRWLKQTFHVLPEYLEDTQLNMAEVNFYEQGYQLTRSFRALKLWLSFKAFGVAAFRAAVARGLELAELAEQVLREDACWQIVSPATLGIVAFRFAPVGVGESELDRLNQQLVNAVREDGFAFASSTILRGQTVLRMCTINPRTTEDDIRAAIARWKILGLQLLTAELPLL
ncbi:MAG: aminotransferase class V-fold PLP-dependent enzyme [Acidobacteria bacterium]|nr:aminotransferase class V-fold PLP-dependent enzyme [Acidobacteriota bacterium]MBI3425288.1 aminotransferase class V-fold PLP-dependent enzyme [Acidobacteriota bacterium]